MAAPELLRYATTKLQKKLWPVMYLATDRTSLNPSSVLMPMNLEVAKPRLAILV